MDNSSRDRGEKREIDVIFSKKEAVSEEKEIMQLRDDKQEDLTFVKKEKKRGKRLKLSAVKDFNDETNKRGVLYISRIPPRMGPAKIKVLLATFGEVSRVYLEPEDASARKRRRKAGGKDWSKRYTEGWVEYTDKKVAKNVARELNTTPITNDKRSVHYGDLWNIKYLRKFKWSHLTEKITYERRVREHKVRIEMMQAKKENASYLNLLEKGQKIDHMEKKKKKKSDITRQSTNESFSDKLKQRNFHQTKPIRVENSVETKTILNSLV